MDNFIYKKSKLGEGQVSDSLVEATSSAMKEYGVDTEREIAKKHHKNGIKKNVGIKLGNKQKEDNLKEASNEAPNLQRLTLTQEGRIKEYELEKNDLRVKHNTQRRNHYNAMMANAGGATEHSQKEMLIKHKQERMALQNKFGLNHDIKEELSESKLQKRMDHNRKIRDKTWAKWENVYRPNAIHAIKKNYKAGLIDRGTAESQLKAHNEDPIKHLGEEPETSDVPDTSAQDTPPIPGKKTMTGSSKNVVDMEPEMQDPAYAYQSRRPQVGVQT